MTWWLVWAILYQDGNFGSWELEYSTKKDCDLAMKHLEEMTHSDRFLKTVEQLVISCETRMVSTRRKIVHTGEDDGKT